MKKMKYLLHALLFAGMLFSAGNSVFASVPETPETSPVYSQFADSITVANTGEIAEPNDLTLKPYKVIVSQTTIRTGPGSSYAAVATIYKKDIVYVRSINDGWAKIRLNSKWRYVKSSDITKYN